MSLRLRLMLVLLAVYCAGGYYLTRQALEQAPDADAMLRIIRDQARR